MDGGSFAVQDLNFEMMAEATKEAVSGEISGT
jgi:hypothetical protein